MEGMGAAPQGQVSNRPLTRGSNQRTEDESILGPSSASGTGTREQWQGPGTSGPAPGAGHCVTCP